MRLALAVASIIVFIVHGVVFYDQFFHHWERHQTAYFDQARAESTNEAERLELASRRPKIEQIIVTQFGESQVDRCTTCHIAADDPRFEEHFEPMRTHPYSETLGDTEFNGRWERRHKFADFGCTVCHDGQGRGLEETYSHGEDHYWPMPLLGYVVHENWNEEYQPKLLGTEYMEANCAQCHTEDGFSGTTYVQHGRQLYFDQACYGCHRIEGLSESTLGPDLSEIGKTFMLDYLWESIVDPRANLATSFMPKFNLSEDDTKAIVIFLKSRRGINYTETSLDRYRAALEGRERAPAEPVAPVEDLAVFGEELIRVRACTACHKLNDQDGLIAPDLSFEGLVRDETWLMEHFLNPRSVVSDSIMPAFRWDEGDFRALTAHLLTLTTAAPVMNAEATYQAFCSRCHGVEGGGDGPITLYLDPAPRDLTKAAFMNSKTPERFLTSIREGVPGTSMPPWQRVLEEEQAQDVLDHVLTTFVTEPRRELKPRNVPDQNPVAMSDESFARGEATYLRRCTGCHGLKADGKGPNSPDILPRPRNLRNSAFVDSLDDRRFMESILYGVQGTAMPPWIDYGLSNNDAGDVVNYIRSLNVRR
jgi:mono/diheme cytochrome c family protein